MLNCKGESVFPLRKNFGAQKCGFSHPAIRGVSFEIPLAQSSIACRDRHQRPLWVSFATRVIL